jgi:hypothetical protein
MVKSKFTHRSPAAVFILTIITFGLYWIYWLATTTSELRKYDKEAPHPGLIFLFFIPFVNFIVAIIYYWKYAKSINKVTGFDTVGMFLLMVLIPSIGMIIAQIEFNRGMKPKKGKKEITQSYKVIGILQLVISSIWLLIYFFSSSYTIFYSPIWTIAKLLIPIGGLVGGIILIKKVKWAPTFQFWWASYGLLFYFAPTVVFWFIYGFHFMDLIATIASNLIGVIYLIFIIAYFQKSWKLR